jgi:hypothetical protein
LVDLFTNIAVFRGQWGYYRPWRRPTLSMVTELWQQAATRWL